MAKKRKKAKQRTAREDSKPGEAHVSESAGPALPPAGSLRAWVLAARPRTLPVAVAPVSVGAAISFAMGHIRVIPLVVALLAALLIQIGTNFANDVFDFEKGADQGPRVGPPRAVQSGLLDPRVVKRGMWITFALATGLGAYLAYTVGPVIVAVGIASILSGIAYTGGPFPLAYNGLGDVFVFLFFGGVAVVGSTYVGSGQIPPLAILAAVPVGALATAVLVVNNVRDVETDTVANKRTLVVRFGRRFGIVEYFALLIVAFAVPGVMVALKWTSPWVLLSLAVVPRALRVATKVALEKNGIVLTACLAQTAQIMLAHSLLIAAGIAAKVM